MAQSCSISVSRTTGMLNNKLPKYPFLSLLLTPTKVSFLASCPSWVSLKRSKFSPLKAITLVARAANWAQQEEKRREETGAGLDGVGLREEAFRDDDEEYYTEPAQEARIYVGNLPYAVDSEGLARLFNRAGIVETAEVMYKRRTKQSKGFGFVTMSTIEESQRAVGMFHRYLPEVQGCRSRACMNLATNYMSVICHGKLMILVWSKFSVNMGKW